MSIPGFDGVESRTVAANGHRIYLLEAGEGPLVLFCHGFPEISYTWRHQLRALAAAGYHAVAVDMLGYGRSSKPAGVETRITEQIRTLAGVVGAVGHETACIVGHDVGAPVAWSAAWTRPDVFTAVAGVSVPFGGRGLFAWPPSRGPVRWRARSSRTFATGSTVSSTAPRLGPRCRRSPTSPTPKRRSPSCAKPRS